MGKNLLNEMDTDIWDHLGVVGIILNKYHLIRRSSRSSL